MAIVAKGESVEVLSFQIRHYTHYIMSMVVSIRALWLLDVTVDHFESKCFFKLVFLKQKNMLF